MFKAIGDFLYKTPWWGLTLAGIATLAVLVMFALPVHVIRLVDSGQNPAQNRAIQREIGLAVGDRALTMAKGVVSAMQERSADDARKAELDHALAEIEHAREELVRAQNGSYADGLASAREAADSALETAKDAAESARDAAQEAREAVEEAKQDALDHLRGKSLDISSTQHAFDQLIAAARDNEKAAVDALTALRTLPLDVRVEPPIAPNIATAITPANGKPVPALSAEQRGDIRSQVGSDVWRVATGSVLILAFIPLFVTLLIAKIFIGRSRRAMELADRKTREAELSDVSRQITEARLQALQAQVEPHFLYNTLANVQALNEVDPPAANQMVGHLIQYLRASLPKMRQASSTVGQELELVRAYLNILRMRMGERLAFDIHADDAVLACAFPPMMLPSLVENAIKHGLEPLREGGRIEVVVERLSVNGSERLRVQVIDTGKGLTDAPSQPSGGVGLSNLRERLNALYGADGRFTLASNAAQGVVATVEIPVRSSANDQGVPPAQAPGSKPPIHAHTGWRSIWYASSAIHSIWVRTLARVFVVLIVLLAGLLLAALIGLMTGWLPVQVGDLRLDGLEGLAIGSVGLLMGFAAAALAVAIVVAVLYGVGFLLVALLVLIPSAILAGLFPVLSPFILLGLVMWWVVHKRRA